MAKLSFDSSKYEPQKPMDPVPKGWYPVIITKSDVVPTKTDPKGGTRMELEVEIIDGDYKGRKAWDGLNIKNKNPVAEKIGGEQLSALCHATGTFKFTDTAQLHDKPFEIKLGYEGDRESSDGKDTYDARNVFKGFRPLEGATPQAGAAGAGKAAPAWAGKGKAATPAPAPAPEPAPDAGPAGGDQAERPFYVVVENETIEKTGAELATMLGQGLPEDTPVMAQDEPEGTEWKTAADYEVAPWSPPVEEKKAPTPPKKPAAPSKPAAPAPTSKATPAGAKPPWKK